MSSGNVTVPLSDPLCWQCPCRCWSTHDGGKPSAYPSAISIAGVDALSRADMQQCGQSHVTYGRWLGQPSGHTQSSPQLVPQGVRLSHGSLLSLAQVSPYVPDMHLSAGSCPQVGTQVNDVNVTGDRAAAAAELLRKGKNNTGARYITEEVVKSVLVA
eukprot:XP_001689528.1 predicted protein [Chlamydomonas reinhardtii]